MYWLVEGLKIAIFSNDLDVFISSTVTYVISEKNNDLEVRKFQLQILCVFVDPYM